MTGKEQCGEPTGTYWGAGNVLYFDVGGHYMEMCVCIINICVLHVISQ